MIRYRRMHDDVVRSDAIATTARRAWTTAAIIALLAVLALFGAGRATAADISGQVTKTASVGAGTYNEWGKIRVDITWNVARANPDDTFRMPLDRALDADKFTGMSLKAPTGEVVANVAIVKTAAGAIARDASGNAILEFTFTNYVATHRNLSGTAWFEIQFDHDRITFPGTSTTLNTTVYGTTITIRAQPGVVGNEAIKYGNWLSPNSNEGEATKLNPDGTSANPGADIIWTVQLQGGASSRAPGWTSVTVTETASAGWHFECPLTPQPWTIRKDLTTSLDRWVNSSTPGITVTSCSRTALTITVTKAASDNNIYRLRFPAWIDGAPLPQAFNNSAQLRYNTPTGAPYSHTVSTSFARALQGGDGVGTIGPRIDIENYCQSWSGVRFTGTTPQLGATGQPVPQPSPCDYDASPGLPVSAGASTPVTFRITNTGNEVLRNVVVTDRTTAGTALRNIVCTFNGSTGMPFTGFAPGQSFLCTATLPAITAPHGNVATVTGIGVQSGVAVNDSDAWHAQPRSIVLPPSTPRLTIAKRAAVNLAITGRNLRWRVTIRNTGSAPAVNVKVCDILRDDQAFPTTRVSYVIGTGKRKGATIVVAAGRGCFTIPTLTAGQRAVVTVTTAVPASARNRVRNSVSVSADRVPPIGVTARVPVRRVKGQSFPSPTG